MSFGLVTFDQIYSTFSESKSVDYLTRLSTLKEVFPDSAVFVFCKFVSRSIPIFSSCLHLQLCGWITSRPSQLPFKIPSQKSSLKETRHKTTFIQ
eukprot:763458-Hanusia_phi.AAC.4